MQWLMERLVELGLIRYDEVTGVWLGNMPREKVLFGYIRAGRPKQHSVDEVVNLLADGARGGEWSRRSAAIGIKQSTHYLLVREAVSHNLVRKDPDGTYRKIQETAAA